MNDLQALKCMNEQPERDVRLDGEQAPECRRRRPRDRAPSPRLANLWLQSGPMHPPRHVKLLLSGFLTPRSLAHDQFRVLIALHPTIRHAFAEEMACVCILANSVPSTVGYRGVFEAASLFISRAPTLILERYRPEWKITGLSEVARSCAVPFAFSRRQFAPLCALNITLGEMDARSFNPVIFITFINTVTNFTCGRNLESSAAPSRY